MTLSRAPCAILHALPEDLAMLQDVFRDARPYAMTGRSSLQCYFTDQNSGIFKAVQDDAIQGFLGYAFFDNAAEIGHLFVRKKKQKLGIGGKLLDDFVVQAQEAQVKIITLNDVAPKAVDFYRHHDFQVFEGHGWRYLP